SRVARPVKAAGVLVVSMLATSLPLRDGRKLCGRVPSNEKRVTAERGLLRGPSRRHAGGGALDLGGQKRTTWRWKFEAEGDRRLISCPVCLSFWDKEWRRHDRPQYTEAAHGSSEMASLTTRRAGATEVWPHGCYLEFTYESRQMRIDHVRILLMLLGALVTMGCNAQSPVNSSPSTSQGTAGNSRADAPGVAKPSSELSQAAAVGSTSDSPKVAKPSSGLRQAAAGSSTSDSPKVARSSSATDGSQAASSAQPSNRTVPRASVKPSAEQIAKWGIPEFEPLALLACRDGFAEPALLGMAISP